MPYAHLTKLWKPWPIDHLRWFTHDKLRNRDFPICSIALLNNPWGNWNQQAPNEFWQPAPKPWPKGHPTRSATTEHPRPRQWPNAPTWCETNKNRTGDLVIDFLGSPWCQRREMKRWGFRMLFFLMDRPCFHGTTRSFRRAWMHLDSVLVQYKIHNGMCLGFKLMMKFLLFHSATKFYVSNIQLGHTGSLVKYLLTGLGRNH